jgi:hypothetical protein
MAKPPMGLGESDREYQARMKRDYPDKPQWHGELVPVDFTDRLVQLQTSTIPRSQDRRARSKPRQVSVRPRRQLPCRML